MTNTGAASVARAWTANFDALLNKTIEKAMIDCCKIDVPGFAEYPDFFSFLIVMLLTGKQKFTDKLIVRC